MPDHILRRKYLGYLAGTVGGFTLASAVGSSNEDDATQDDVTNASAQAQACNGMVGEPGAGEVNVHVVSGGSHRGENNFSYFLNRASLGLDPNQPDEVYSRVFVKLDDDWVQPTLDDTCKVYWAGCNLSAGSAGQGGHPPTGDDGWSVRVYTRGPVTNGKVSLGSYVYHLDQHGNFGSLWPWPDKAPIGRWNRLDTYVRLNSVSNGTANQDGVVRTWLNGTPQTSHTDLRWRTTEALGFDRLGPGSYWGGTEGAPENNILYYDTFRYNAGADHLDA